jgi:hypothetical protein
MNIDIEQEKLRISGEVGELQDRIQQIDQAKSIAVESLVERRGQLRFLEELELKEDYIKNEVENTDGVSGADET